MTQTTTTTTIEARLPRELVEEILTIHVNSDHTFDYLWTQLRRLSPYQKARIEERFFTRLLPLLGIVIHSGQSGARRSHSYTFVHDTSVNNSSNDKVRYSRFKSGKPVHMVGKFTMESWTEHDIPDHPEADWGPARIGLHSNGMIGGYTISNSEVPGLMVDETGAEVQFEWRAFFAAAARESIRDRESETEK